ncbi:YwqI/YxiC family protein [Bacillus weihaiensis]|uniref:YwqI/YxiC family protein n=1 Tax=Bacillus weihaiensis TaxID=1547283 RepID=UPI0023570470|nr:YwqI/YxiC family protein [Bacillus weihaiensis]
MVTIKLNYGTVVKELNEAKSALQSINLRSPRSKEMGKNKLDYTSYFLEREAQIHQLLSEYVSIVEKNIDDTKVNVRSLKEQDEAVTRG